MRLLLIDNSNTRTKFALSDEHKLMEWKAVITTAEISVESLAELLKDVSWDASIVSSVVPEKAKILQSFLNSKSKPCHNLSYLSCLPIGISYPKPEQIGADRLANATAAYVHYGSPSIVLDFGTAVTFDVIAPSDTGSVAYLGGVIAPGLASMTEGLANRTALLPHIQLAEPERAIGKSTEEAMLSGAVYGYRGLVKEILKNLSAELTSEPTIVATGGDAALITKGLPEIQHLSPQLTLEGLRILASLNL
ncbi:MAG: type III pantothenate kinase [Akkermansiaceae bacterium]